jgi:hypothetical protein
LPVTSSVDDRATVSFTSLDGHTLEATYGQAPAINGLPVDYSSWKLFDGPFAQSDRESQQVLIRHGSETLNLDFATATTESSVTPASR